MKKILIATLFILSNFITGVTANATIAKAENILLKCDEMLNVRTGKVEKNISIFTKDGKILKIDRTPKTFAQAYNIKTIELKNQLCMPGWIDTHVHFEQQFTEGMNVMSQPDEARQVIDSWEFPKRNLMAGFTTVRDLNSLRNVAIEFRNAVAAGKMIGPRILATRSGITALNGHGDGLDPAKPSWANGVKEAFADFYGWIFLSKKGSTDQVDTWYKSTFISRPDWLKTFKSIASEDKTPDAVKVFVTGGVVSPNPDSHRPQLSVELISRAVVLAEEYSKKIGKPLTVAAHTHGIEGILQAAQAGVHSLEHATELGGSLKDYDAAKPSDQKESAEFETQRAEAIKLIKEKGIYIVPTVTAGFTVWKMAQDGKIPDPVITEKSIRVGGKMMKNIKVMMALNLPMAFGSDTGISKHGDNWHEFVLLVEKGGMTPTQAFQTATLHSAKLLRRDNEFGLLEEGLSADIIALPSDVMKNINKVNQVKFVMKQGTVYKL